MLIRYLNGEYTGESSDVEPILWEVSPHINNKDAAHIEWILTQGCPSHLVFKETTENKLAVIWKGNQHTFLQHPKVMAKAMNKEEKTATSYPSGTGRYISPRGFESPCKAYARSAINSASSLIHPRRQAPTRLSWITWQRRTTKLSLILD